MLVPRSLLANDRLAMMTGDIIKPGSSLYDNCKTVLIPFSIIRLTRTSKIENIVLKRSKIIIVYLHWCWVVVLPLGQVTLLWLWFTRPPVQKYG